MSGALPTDYVSPYTSTGLVRELADTMKCGIPTHPDWPETLSCSLVSMMMGKSRYIENVLGTIYSNHMVIVIGSSGISYKTVPLKKWMRPSRRHAGLLLNPARVRVEYQPLGVVGIIVPWIPEVL